MLESLNFAVAIYAIAALASSVAAVLAWASKLWWAKEYASAKNETIRAKEAQIELLKTELENLRQLTPMKLREYFLSVKEQLEEYNGHLRQELATAHEDIKRKDDEIRHFLESLPPGTLPGGPSSFDNPQVAKIEARLQSLQSMKNGLQAKANSLEQKLRREEEVRKSFAQLLSLWNESKKETEGGKNLDH
jgi:chromosome segregation ATPase